MHRIMKSLCYLLLAGACTITHAALAETSAAAAGQLAFQVRMVQSSCTINLSGNTSKENTVQFSDCPGTPYQVNIITDGKSQNTGQPNAQMPAAAFNIDTTVRHSMASAEKSPMPISEILVTYY